MTAFNRTQYIFGVYDPVSGKLLGVTPSGNTPYSAIPGSSAIVSTFAALRLQLGTQVQTVIATGKLSQSDGSGGTFVLNASDTTSGAWFLGTISGTVLTVVSVNNGTLAVGQSVNRGDTGASVGTILSLGTGTGGTGTYNLSASLSIPNQITFSADNNSTTLVGIDGSRWNLATTVSALVGPAIYGTDSGAVNAYVFTHSATDPPATLAVGTVIRLTVLNTNTSSATLNADGTGAVAIIRANGSALTGGELSSLGPVVLQSTGTQWQIVSSAGAQPGYERTAAEIAAAVIPPTLGYKYLPGNLFRYGALIDGSTNDTTAVQNAINSNSYVFHPGGNCIITTVNVASNQTIAGIGPASIFTQKSGQANFTRPFVVSAQSFVDLRDFQINGNGNAQASGEQNAGIIIGDSTDVLCTNLTIHDCQGDCIAIISNSSSILARRITVTYCNMYNLGRMGVSVTGYGARDIVIANNTGRVGTYVTTSTTHGNPIHIELDNTPVGFIGNITIADNICNDAGISVSGNFSGVDIVGNTIRNVLYTALQAGIWVIAGVDTTISGNTIMGDGATVIDGIQVEDAGLSGAPIVRALVICNNVIDNVAGSGINAFGTGVGAPSLGSVNISDNVVTNIGAGGVKNAIIASALGPNIIINSNIIKTGTSGGILVQGCSNFVVSNNQIAEMAASTGMFFDTTSGIGVGPGIVTGNSVTWATPAGKTGITIGSTATNTRITITGNDLGSTATPVSIGGAAVKCSSYANIGGNDALTGSFTLGAAVTTTVNNANVTAACKILLVPTNAAAATLMGSAKALYVSARTAGTSFAVSTANAVAAAGTETFEFWVSV